MLPARLILWLPGTTRKSGQGWSCQIAALIFRRCCGQANRSDASYFCSTYDMFAGNDLAGTNGAPMALGLQGRDQKTAQLATEAIPFEHRLMTKREISKYFGVTERTIEVWMRRRYIPFIKIGQTVRFRVASVLRYVDEKYLVPAGAGGRRRRNHCKQRCCGDAGPDGAGGIVHRDPPCDSSGAPGT